MSTVWLRPEQSGVGRPGRRSRAEITHAAVHLADREGLDAVTGCQTWSTWAFRPEASTAGTRGCPTAR